MVGTMETSGLVCSVVQVRGGHCHRHLSTFVQFHAKTLVVAASTQQAPFTTLSTSETNHWFGKIFPFFQQHKKRDKGALYSRRVGRAIPVGALHLATCHWRPNEPTSLSLRIDGMGEYVLYVYVVVVALARLDESCGGHCCCVCVCLGAKCNCMRCVQ